ncbi:MAG: hypothetical protein VR65_10560 [Desulfobulbaceae bacterium BRH_c16a]|nr:MAG: hypothetical protein VR65_10560 [Desulfobulbaceae bacterium BRH_c16a]
MIDKVGKGNRSYGYRILFLQHRKLSPLILIFSTMIGANTGNVRCSQFHQHFGTKNRQSIDRGPMPAFSDHARCVQNNQSAGGIAYD